MVQCRYTDRIGEKNMQTLRVHKDKRHLETADGERFYLIGDTAWELFHALDREEAAYYLRTRQAQGFNMIQAVVLAELDGLEKPNAYGRRPLLKNASGNWDPSLPDSAGEYGYFDHAEYIVSLAERLGLYIGMLPTWGDKYNTLWGVGPEVFTEENAFLYGRWLGERFSQHNNILWILGGDRPLDTEEHHRIINVMAHGLHAGDGGKFPMTFHPCGAHSSSQYVHGRDWLDFHMMQSGHGQPSPWCFDMMAADYGKADFVPVMDGEPCYEDHPINFQSEKGYYDAYDVRRAALWNLFGGACGNTYGHHAVWQMRREPDAYCPNTWRTALHRPGAMWIRLYRDFIRENDLTGFVPVYDIVENNTHDCSYTAGMVSDRSAYLYIPCGIPVRLNRNVLPFKPFKAVLWEPTTGQYVQYGVQLTEDGLLSVPGRASGRGMDMVVILS